MFRHLCFPEGGYSSESGSPPTVPHKRARLTSLIFIPCFYPLDTGFHTHLLVVRKGFQRAQERREPTLHHVPWFLHDLMLQLRNQLQAQPGQRAVWKQKLSLRVTHKTKRQSIYT